MTRIMKVKRFVKKYYPFSVAFNTGSGKVAIMVSPSSPTYLATGKTENAAWVAAKKYLINKNKKGRCA